MDLELLKSRRSIRKYEDREIEKEKLDIIIKSALLAPSSRGRRPWEFIVIKDKETLLKLSKVREHSSSFIAGAAAGIVILADPELCDVWVEDASIAATIIQLSAHQLGLGSCWIQIRERVHRDNVKAEDYIKEVLGIPDKYHVECMIALGYPGEVKQGYSEDALHYEKIHYERF